MKKKLGIIIVLLLCAIMIGSFIQNKLEDNQAIKDNVKGYDVDLESTKSGIKKGQFAPDFTFVNLQGEEVSLSDYRGKKVVLNFWNTWCNPCKSEMPHMQKYYEKFSEEDHVEIIGVNLKFNSDSTEKVEEFVASYKLDFPILLADDDSVVDDYEIITIPSTLFIDEEGKVQRKIVGPIDVDALSNYVEDL